MGFCQEQKIHLTPASHQPRFSTSTSLEFPGYLYNSTLGFSLAVVPPVSSSPSAPDSADPAVSVACDGLVKQNRRLRLTREQRVSLTEQSTVAVVLVTVVC